jgi:hypothetical protein
MCLGRIHSLEQSLEPKLTETKSSIFILGSGKIAEDDLVIFPLTLYNIIYE